MKLTHKEKYLLMEILVFINDFDFFAKQINDNNEKINVDKYDFIDIKNKLYSELVKTNMKKEMVYMKPNLKEKDRVTFGDDAFANVENYSVDISGLSGTIVHISEDKSEIHVKMKEEVGGFEEYDNTIYFGSGTDVDVLYETITKIG